MKPVIRTRSKVEKVLRDWVALPAGALLLLGLLAGAGGARRAADEPAKEQPKEQPKPKVEAGVVEVRFTDNSVIKLTLRDERVELVTPYGKLQIPVADIHRIEFATRLSAEDAKRIPGLIADLGSQVFATRDTATTELLKLREKAYPALLQATKNSDPEVVRRAEDLLEKIRGDVPEDQLKVRAHDVIHTEHSKFTGKLTGLVLKATTNQFGDVPLKLADVRSLRSMAVELPTEDVAVNAIPDPGSLLEYQNQFGKVLVVKVTGAVGNGGLWGSDVYTLDSSLAMAAVHAGAIKNGQTGNVRVRIIAPPAGFEGTTRNGVTSQPWQAFPQGAFQFIKRGGANP